MSDTEAVACPTCGADEGEPCVFFGGEGAGEERSSPHTTRRGRARRQGGATSA